MCSLQRTPQPTPTTCPYPTCSWHSTPSQTPRQTTDELRLHIQQTHPDLPTTHLTDRFFNNTTSTHADIATTRPQFTSHHATSKPTPIEVTAATPPTSTSSKPHSATSPPPKPNNGWTNWPSYTTLTSHRRPSDALRSHVSSPRQNASSSKH